MLVQKVQRVKNEIQVQKVLMAKTALAQKLNTTTSLHAWKPWKQQSQETENKKGSDLNEITAKNSFARCR